MKFLRVIKYTIYYGAISVFCLELAFWVLGYRPYLHIDYKLVSNPTPAYSGDSLLGFKLNEGVFQITLNDSLEYVVTHNDMNQRVIPFDYSKNDCVPNVHFFGCSYTYGYGVNDDEHFVALVQKFHPELKVHNHAVMGYGLVQAWLILSQMSDLKKNDRVLFCLSSVHFDRNVLSREFRKQLKIGFENSGKLASQNLNYSRFPFYNEHHEIAYIPWDSLYHHWPGRNFFCSVNYLQSKYDDKIDQSTERIFPAKKMIEQMKKFCDSLQVDFMIFCLDSSEETNQLKAGLPDVKWVEAGFNFNDTTLTNHPYDLHANADGHQLLFTKLNPVFKGE